MSRSGTGGTDRNRHGRRDTFGLPSTALLVRADLAYARFLRTAEAAEDNTVPAPDAPPGRPPRRTGEE